MNRILACALVAFPLMAPPARAQDWTDDELVKQVPGFQFDSLAKILTQAADLLPHQKEAFAAMFARIHGDHREYMLKIDRLIGELTDARWAVREQAERTLIEIGARAQDVLSQHVEKFTVLEESIRCKRILQKIVDRGTEQEDREKRLLRGLVITTLYMEHDPRLLRALRSALGHTDAMVVDWTLRSLGVHGTDDEADAVLQLLGWKGGIYRQTALASLSRMRAPKALEICTQLASGKDMTRSELCALQVGLHQRGGAEALLQALAAHADPVVAAGAKTQLPAVAPGAEGAKVKLTLGDKERTVLDGRLVGFLGDSARVSGAIKGLPEAEIAFADCNVFDFPDHVVQPITNTRVFLRQGSLVTGKLVSMDEKDIRLDSPVFHELVIPRGELQGIAVDPGLDRLLGASTEHDRVRLKSNEFLDGTIKSLVDGKINVALSAGGERQVPIADVSGLLTTRPKTTEPDATVYARIDLVNGDRVIGFLVGSTATHLAFTAPLIGAAVVPITSVARVEIGVGGGAMWGFTLIADYSDNRVVEVDEQGKITWELDDVFGAWDAVCLDNGNILITEFSVSRVSEVDRKGNRLWVYEDLKNPYCADRLPNGNTLIGDTFGGRVIEVSPQKEIVWKYDKEIRPFDAKRLANGNTLISDVLKDRVIEVSPQGEIVWELKNMNNVHDADRLPNGNTLITLRSKGQVIEVDREGKVVWELNGLMSPSDADRLPNGNTLVAENNAVREFDRHGNVVWKKEMTWAVEANRY